MATGDWPDEPERTRRGSLRPEERADYWQLQPGMPVVGSDGGSIGTVKEARPTDFLVSRPLALDVYVPYGFCRAREAGQVILTVPAGDVGDMGWAHPGASLSGAA